MQFLQYEEKWQMLWEISLTVILDSTSLDKDSRGHLLYMFIFGILAYLYAHAPIE